MIEKKEPGAFLTDRWSIRDDLRFSDFRPALKNILMEAQTPLTLGVFGPWGSGKTSLLRMLEDDISQEATASVRTVWFTAWKYTRQEALWRAFVLRVLDGLFERSQALDQDQEKMLRRMEESVYRPVDWEELGKLTINWWQMLKEGGKGVAEIAAAFVPGAEFFKKTLKVLGGDLTADADFEKAAASIGREVSTYHRAQLQSMEQFEGTFREALKYTLGENGRLVVFVDDLDRCLPEKALEVLEAIKVFLEVEGTVFVLGMDQEVIERGIEAHYGSALRSEGTERRELPIRGDVYLQKVVQIPFQLPPLAVGELEQFITELEKRVPEGTRLSEMTRLVFAQGLFPNPRQVKRALNIFRLLREIALKREAREEEGGLVPGSVAWPLLAKTVLIQTQWPLLYSEWRQRPTLVQTLEDAYARTPTKDEEIVWGRTDEIVTREDSVQKGAILEPYLSNRRRYALLERLLTFPSQEDAGEGRDRARFSGLSLDQMAIYIRLAGTMETTETPVEAPVDLLEELFSGDQARINEALSRLDEKETDRNGPMHQGVQSALLKTMQDPVIPKQTRVGAGDGLARLGDPRFQSDAWFLPDDMMLGFKEVPAGTFTMGSDKDDISRLVERFGGDREYYEKEIPRRKPSVETFYMNIYPVTVAQFKAFSEDKSYTQANEESVKGPPNHPVTHVSWHDAVAYCEWLTDKLRHTKKVPETIKRLLDKDDWLVRLPTEEEWEKAARGNEDARIFPWGDNPDPDNANYDESGIGNTSAVGCFPKGVSPYGILDMSGNIWEWCATKWEDNYKNYKNHNEPGGNEPRVLRGGAFSDSRRNVRCAARNWDYPLGRYYSVGFRVVVAPRLTSDH